MRYSLNLLILLIATFTGHAAGVMPGSAGKAFDFSGLYLSVRNQNLGTSDSTIVPSPEGMLHTVQSSIKNSYAVVGTNMANCILDVVLSVASSLDATTNCHFGVGIRATNKQNFAIFMLCPNAGGSDGPGVFHIAVRTNTTGEVRYDFAIAKGVDHGRRYRMRIANVTGNDVALDLWDVLTGEHLIDNYTGFTIPTDNWTGGTTGNQIEHSLGCIGVVHSMFLYDAATNLVMGNTQPWSQARAVQGGTGSVPMSSGVCSLYSNGSSGSGNTWSCPMSQLTASDFTMTGYLKRVSGRDVGVSFRNQAATIGYAILYDNNDTHFRLFSGATPTEIGSPSGAVTLTAGTDYPFTLQVRGTNFVFTANGVTFTTGDYANTYTNGYLGLLGYQALAEYHDIRIFP